MTSSLSALALATSSALQEKNFSPIGTLNLESDQKSYKIAISKGTYDQYYLSGDLGKHKIEKRSFFAMRNKETNQEIIFHIYQVIVDVEEAISYLVVSENPRRAVTVSVDFLSYLNTYIKKPELVRQIDCVKEFIKTVLLSSKEKSKDSKDEKH